MPVSQIEIYSPLEQIAVPSLQLRHPALHPAHLPPIISARVATRTERRLYEQF